MNTTHRLHYTTVHAARTTVNAGQTLRATGPTPNEGNAQKTCYWQSSGQDTHRHVATVGLDLPTQFGHDALCGCCDKQPLLHAVVVTNNLCFMRLL